MTRAPPDPRARKASQLLAVAGAWALAAAGCPISDPENDGDGEIVWSVPMFLMTDRMVVAGDAVIVGDHDGRLLRLDRQTGTVRWERQLDDVFWGKRLERIGSLVYATAYDLHAVDIETGAVHWTYGGLGGWGVGRSPTVADGDLYVPSAWGGVARLDGATGAVRWEVDIGESVFPAAVAGDLVIVGTRSFGDLNSREGPLGAGRVVALSRADGSTVWEVAVPDSAGFPLSGGVTTRPLVIGDMVIVGTRSSHVLGLRLTDGSLVWEYSDGSPRISPYGSGAVFGSTAVLLRSDGRLDAFDPRTGALVWTLGRGEGFATSLPFVFRGRLYAVLEAGLWVIGEAGGVDWRFGSRSLADERPKFVSGPTVDADGIAYAWTAGSGSGELLAVRMPFRP